MKKVKAIIACTMLLISGLAWGQNAHETTIKFNKTHQNGIVAEYNQPAAAIEATIRKKLAEDGLTKIKNNKGFLTLSGVKWTSISSDNVDVYIKVAGKKDKSTVNVLVSKGYDNFISSQSDPKTVDRIKDFLNDLNWYASIHQQEETILKADKDLQTVNNSNKELLAQKEKLEKRIEEGNNNALLKQKALDQEKQKLEALKTKSY